MVFQQNSFVSQARKMLMLLYALLPTRTGRVNIIHFGGGNDDGGKFLKYESQVIVCKLDIHENQA